VVLSLGRMLIFARVSGSTLQTHTYCLGGGGGAGVGGIPLAEEGEDHLDVGWCANDLKSGFSKTREIVGGVHRCY